MNRALHSIRIFFLLLSSLVACGKKEFRAAEPNFRSEARKTTADLNESIAIESTPSSIRYSPNELDSEEVSGGSGELATPSPPATPESTPSPPATPESTPSPSATPESTPSPSATPEETPSPSPSPALTPSPTNDDFGIPVQLRIYNFQTIAKVFPAISQTGPLYLDTGEVWPVVLEVLVDGVWQPISTDSEDLTFESSDSEIVTTGNRGYVGGLLGRNQGSSRVLASYQGLSFEFDVFVRPGCWGDNNGSWVSVAGNNARSLDAECKLAGHRVAICARRCGSPYIPLGGSDVHLPLAGANYNNLLVHHCQGDDSIGVSYEMVFCRP